MRVPLVLFVCTENTARSQMAEALLRQQAGEQYEVASCGLRPAPAVHPLAVEVMREIGVDLSAQHPKGAAEFLGKRSVQFAIVVCESAEPQCPRLWPMPTARVYWPIPDPAAVTGTKAKRLAAFRAARDQLAARISAWLAERNQAAMAMDLPQAVLALGALAQESRLAVFRLLIRHGSAGLAAGQIAASLAIPPNTLSFHLTQLAHAGLIASRRAGRSIIYQVNQNGVRALLHYLTEDCCGNAPELCHLSTTTARPSEQPADRQPGKQRTKQATKRGVIQ